MKKPNRRLTPESFAAAFKTASRKLWCLAVAVLGGTALAEDVVQDAAVTALQRLDTFEVGSNFEAWMGQIVRFTALNHVRRHYRTRELPSEHLEQAPGPRPLPGRLDEDPAGASGWEDHEFFDDAVTRALRQLEETPRTCFLMRTLMDVPYREIATILGIPEGTAMSHVHRSRAALRHTLESDAAFETAAHWRAS